jgi:hypothetical protein
VPRREEIKNDTVRSGILEIAVNDNSITLTHDSSSENYYFGADCRSGIHRVNETGITLFLIINFVRKFEDFERTRCPTASARLEGTYNFVLEFQSLGPSLPGGCRLIYEVEDIDCLGWGCKLRSFLDIPGEYILQLLQAFKQFFNTALQKKTFE